MREVKNGLVQLSIQESIEIVCRHHEEITELQPIMIWKSVQFNAHVDVLKLLTNLKMKSQTIVILGLTSLSESSRF